MARILAIEDDNDLRGIIASTLSEHTVREARNGKEGIEALRREPFDLVITDLVMPEKDGIESIVQIRQEYPKLKIIAISGATDELRRASLSMAKELGAVRTLAKPFVPHELRATVGEVLRSPGSHL
jgi:DNA-binding response OmpR family regulator